MSYKCAWCKDSTENPALKSKIGETICARCVGKYRYALEVGIAKGKLSDLSKEQRRQVSVELEELRVFYKIIRMAERQSLLGIPKIVNFFVILTLIIILFLVLGWLINRLGEESLLLYVATAGLFCLMIIIYFRIRWSLKFWQLKRKSGYKYQWLNLKP